MWKGNIVRRKTEKKKTKEWGVGRKEKKKGE